mmetsp:Transcript_6619/g.16430  ORF Transcript_6619/g.16430 Transcript_6619/m.16430 type:complete len:321 (+) Transcript_6619:6777-7739(+)
MLVGRFTSRSMRGRRTSVDASGGMLTTTGLPLDETEEEEEAEEAEKAGRRRYAGRARELVKVTVISASSSSTAVIALGVSADDEATDEGDGGGRGGAVLARSCAHCSSTASTHAVDTTTCNGDAAVKESLAPPDTMVPESAPPVTPGSSIGDMNPPAAPLEAASAARVYLMKPFTGSTMGSHVPSRALKKSSEAVKDENPSLAPVPPSLPRTVPTRSATVSAARGIRAPEPAKSNTETRGNATSIEKSGALSLPSLFAPPPPPCLLWLRAGRYAACGEIAPGCPTKIPHAAPLAPSRASNPHIAIRTRLHPLLVSAHTGS